MSTERKTEAPEKGRPKNKATMDQPQEEFIETDSSHVKEDPDESILQIARNDGSLSSSSQIPD